MRCAWFVVLEKKDGDGQVINGREKIIINCEPEQKVRMKGEVRRIQERKEEEQGVESEEQEREKRKARHQT